MSGPDRILRVIASPPDRPCEIHKAPCKHCPSAAATRSGHHDPESLDYKAAPRDVQIESVFPCGWRPEKMCKGYSDWLGVTESDLLELTRGES